MDTSQQYLLESAFIVCGPPKSVLFGSLLNTEELENLFKWNNQEGNIR